MILEIKNVVKKYQNKIAVNHVNFSLKKGSICGLLGPNGAGKTSLIRIITGITYPDEGAVYFENEPFNGLKHIKEIGYMPEERGLYKKMKVGDHVLYLAQLRGLSETQAIEKTRYWFKRLDITNWWHKKIQDLSKGMAQKIQFISTIIHEPKLLILDEPFSGLDPLNSELIKDIIFEIAKNGTTIIFSTHRMEQVEEICDYIILINDGIIILEGDVNTIKQQHFRNEYLITTSPNAHLQNYSNINIVKQIADNKFIIKLNADQTLNTLLLFLIQNNIQIQSCSIVQPNLTEIFINAVQKIK